MVTISLCMIVKNEEEVLARCLDSVRSLVDEIVIVDTGSTDRTREIAARYTDRLYSFPWNDDFAAARNFSLSKATMEYCMWLDADDVLFPCDQIAFRALKSRLTFDTDVVMLKYHTGFDEDGSPTFSYYRERILKNSPDYRFTGAVHEVVPPVGAVLYSDVAVSHKKLRPSDPDRNLRIFEQELAKGHLLDPRQRYYYARELLFHGRYSEAAHSFLAFLEEGLGWLENNIEACSLLAQCYRALGDSAAELRALLRSLEYDRPRAELCCDLGAYFLDRDRLPEAVFWYETALSCEYDIRRGGFVQPDCYGYLPHIQLCVCYDRLGDRARAIKHNEAAGAEKPHSPAYLYNRDYFAALPCSQ